MLPNSGIMAIMTDIHGGFYASHNGKYWSILQVFCHNPIYDLLGFGVGHMRDTKRKGGWSLSFFSFLC